MIDPATDYPVFIIIGVLVIMAFFAAVWPMDRY